jgi:threonine synthase
VNAREIHIDPRPGARPRLLRHHACRTGKRRRPLRAGNWPQFSAADIRALRGKSYAEIAVTVMWPFVEGEIDRAVFETIVREAYATFRHEAVCPLVQTGANEFVLELFHGPTLAFKDVAMQLIGRLMDHVLAERDERATIVGATSGDTGGAAIEAFAGRERTDIFILFPKGRVSPVQQRQMTSSGAANVHALAIEGNFDDCQGLLKDMFNHAAFRDSVKLSGVNSINWARIMAQVVYYFTSALSLGAPDRRSPSRCRPAISATFSPATSPGRWACPSKRWSSPPTTTTFSRARWRPASTRCAASCRRPRRRWTSRFRRISSGCCSTPPARRRNGARRHGQPEAGAAFRTARKALSTIRSGFAAGTAHVAEAAGMIRHVYEKSGYLLDPHTAIGVHVARQQPKSATPMVVLAPRIRRNSPPRSRRPAASIRPARLAYRT